MFDVVYLMCVRLVNNFMRDWGEIFVFFFAKRLPKLLVDCNGGNGDNQMMQLHIIIT